MPASFVMLMTVSDRAGDQGRRLLPRRPDGSPDDAPAPQVACPRPDRHRRHPALGRLRAHRHRLARAARSSARPSRRRGAPHLRTLRHHGPEPDPASTRSMLGLSVATLGTFVAFVFAYVQVRVPAPRPVKLLIHVMALLPIVSPPFALAVAAIFLFGRSGIITQRHLRHPLGHLLLAGRPARPRHRRTAGLQLPPLGLTLIMSLTFFPIAYIMLMGMMRALDPSLDEAAANLGASKWRIFRKVEPAAAGSRHRFGLPAALRGGARRPRQPARARRQLLGAREPHVHRHRRRVQPDGRLGAGGHAAGAGADRLLRAPLLRQQVVHRVRLGQAQRQARRDRDALDPLAPARLGARRRRPRHAAVRDHRGGLVHQAAGRQPRAHAGALRGGALRLRHRRP